MRRRHGLRWTTVAAALSVAVLAGACTATVQGRPTSNQAELNAYKAAQFDAGYKAFTGYFAKHRDEKGTVYWHASFGTKKEDKEIDVFRMGNPPALFTKTKSGGRGFTLDTYHPARSDRDYLLLGEKYRDLAPTPWISTPTLYPADGFNMCLVTGIQTACAMDDALARTLKASPGGLIKEYGRKPDGTVEMLTGVTLKALYEARVLIFTDEMIRQMTPKMKETLIATQIILDPTGALKKFELNGVVDTKDGPRVEIQVGYEVTRKAAAKDFPKAPPEAEVTTLDQAATRDFYKRLNTK